MCVSCTVLEYHNFSDNQTLLAGPSIFPKKKRTQQIQKRSERRKCCPLCTSTRNWSGWRKCKVHNGKEGSGQKDLRVRKQIQEQLSHIVSTRTANIVNGSAAQTLAVPSASSVDASGTAVPASPRPLARSSSLLNPPAATHPAPAHMVNFPSTAARFLQKIQNAHCPKIPRAPTVVPRQTARDHAKVRNSSSNCPQNAHAARAHAVGLAGHATNRHCHKGVFGRRRRFKRRKRRRRGCRGRAYERKRIPALLSSTKSR